MSQVHTTIQTVYSNVPFHTWLFGSIGYGVKGWRFGEAPFQKSSMSIWALPVEEGRRNRAKKKIDLRLNTSFQDGCRQWQYHGEEDIHPPIPPTVLRVPQYAQFLHNQSATMPRRLRKHVWSGARSGAHNLLLTILTTSSEDVGDVSFTHHPFSSHPPDDVLGSKTSGSTYSLKLSFQFVCYPVILISLFRLYTFTPNSLSLFQGGRHVLPKIS